MDQYLTNKWGYTTTNEELLQALVNSMNRKYHSKKWDVSDVGFLVVTGTQKKFYNTLMDAQSCFQSFVNSGKDVSMYLMCRFGNKNKPIWRSYNPRDSFECLYWYSNYGN
jgi:hypothetical protein